MGSTSGEDPGGPAPRQVLVVEDEALIALELEFGLAEPGFGVIGPVPTVAAALALLAGRRPDAAVLDVSLRGERVTPVAEALRAMVAVPFVLASAYGGAELAPDAALAGARNVGRPTRRRSCWGPWGTSWTADRPPHLEHFAGRSGCLSHMSERRDRWLDRIRGTCAAACWQRSRRAR